MMENELKPCPFCGYAHNRPEQAYLHYADTYCFGCQGCTAKVYGATAEDCIAAWNSRAGEGKYRELVEAVAKAAKGYDKSFEKPEEMLEWIDDMNAVFERFYEIDAALKEGRE